MNSSVPPQNHEYGGDEINAIVLDPGSSSVRAGFAGEDTPKSVVPSHYGYHQQDGSAAPEYLFGDNKIHNPRPDIEIRTPFNDEGVVEDWDTAAKLFEYTITSRLTGVTSTSPSKNGLNDQDGDVAMDGTADGDGKEAIAAAVETAQDRENPLAEHPLIMTEPAWNTPKCREKSIEIALEHWGAPAFFLAKTGGLAAFSQGRPTALVIDVGANLTSVTPVFDGFVLKKGVQKSRLASNFISDQIRLQFAQMNPAVPLVPYYMIKSKQTVDAGLPANATYAHFDKPPTDSFRKFQEERVLTSFKESMVQVWQGPGALSAPATVPNQPLNIDIARAQPPRPFEMPDGWNQVFGIERYRVAEGLFDANAALKGPGSEPIDAKHTIPAMVTAALNAVDVEIRPALLSSIVLTGGGSLIDKLADRIQSDLAALYPNPRVKVFATGSSTDRKYGAWIGASIQASLGTFHQMWISKKEYDEHGASVVEKRCK